MQKLRFISIIFFEITDGVCMCHKVPEDSDTIDAHVYDANPRTKRAILLTSVQRGGGAKLTTCVSQPLLYQEQDLIDRFYAFRVKFSTTPPDETGSQKYKVTPGDLLPK
jgi:hypothetical protein